MAEDSNIPSASAVRDSDAVDDNSTIGPQSGRSSPVTDEPEDSHPRIDVLVQKLEKTDKNG